MAVGRPFPKHPPSEKPHEEHEAGLTNPSPKKLYAEGSVQKSLDASLEPPRFFLPWEHSEMRLEQERQADRLRGAGT